VRLRSLVRRCLIATSLVVFSLGLGACAVSPPPTPTVPRTVVVQQPAPTAIDPTASLTPAPPSPTPNPPSPTPVPTTIPSPTATLVPTPVDFSRVHPNELGEIPILEYHLITNDDSRWSRSWEHFRGDLERLYRLGYRTVRLQDIVDDRINVPAGYSPVVLTFDDSSPGQFTFVDENGTLIPDPHSAVGILDAFYREHPDFGRHATFFVLPAADPPHNLFGQDQYQRQKLRYLVEHGMDVGNHTYWHQNLSRVGDAEVRRQIGQAVEVINTMIPNYDVDLFALPEGAWPVHRELVIHGTWHGTTYTNRAIVLVGAQPALSPDRVGFDPLALPRIQAIPDQLDLWLNTLARVPNRRYVSDGDPDRLTFPVTMSSKLRMKPGEERVSSPDPDYEIVQLR
jgi:peptidoglycan/xylan/chitin deacetylase (PgdA/CDA1 family)